MLVVGLLNISISLEDPFDDSALDGVSIHEASDQIAWVSKTLTKGNSNQKVEYSLTLDRSDSRFQDCPKTGRL